MKYLALFLALIIATPATAQDWWPHDDPPKRRVYKKPRVKAWRREEPPILEPRCKAMVSAQGLQGLTELGAKEKANDAWAAEVRARWGERLMDLRHADDYAVRCWRSSIADKPSIPMLSAGETDRAAMEYRCEVKAIPCEPKWQSEAGAGVPTQ